MEEKSRESSAELELRVFIGTVDMLKALFRERRPIPGIDKFEIGVDPLVADLIIANLEFLKPIFEGRVKNGMGGTKKEE